MGFVFHRRLALPLSAVALLTVVLTTSPPATPLLMSSTTLLVAALLGIAAIKFTMPGETPWLRPARSVAHAVPPRHQHKTGGAIAVAAGTFVRTLDEPRGSTADDALDLVRMDDDGGWQITRPT